MQILTLPRALRAIALFGPQRVEPGDARFPVVHPRQILEEIADELVEAGAPSRGEPPSLGDDTIVDRQRYVHAHMVCVHVIRVNGDDANRPADVGPTIPTRHPHPTPESVPRSVEPIARSTPH